jgi:hypothetical protein
MSKIWVKPNENVPSFTDCTQSNGSLLIFKPTEVEETAAIKNAIKEGSLVKCDAPKAEKAEKDAPKA